MPSNQNQHEQSLCESCCLHRGFVGLNLGLISCREFHMKMPLRQSLPSIPPHSTTGGIHPFPRLLSASPLPGSYPLPGQFSAYTWIFLSLYHAEHSTEHVLLLEHFLGVPLSFPSGLSVISLNKHDTLHFFLPYFPIGNAIIPIST